MVVVLDSWPFSKKSLVDYACIVLFFIGLSVTSQGQLVLVVFGPNYAYVVLRLLQNRDWSGVDATVAVGYYRIYVLALALNGM